jgi:Pyruvate/2-oxoacid:ferredoxin oxidoreductase gamma subunit
MTLEDFISESLTQIINGVKKAQTHAEQNGAKVNSSTFRRAKTIGDSYYDLNSGSSVQVIDFDIAVTAKEQGGSSGRAGVFVTVFGAGIEGSESSENFTSNRIKFSVPISLPYQKTKE